ncbi:hypothetical protein LTS18_005575 [Coniosporium uncinatum]|uniref:Uncharacterized protein n=1 Tax=Coniosporium uncinatum TaxID=93489 RepID=A0ACC3DXF9_9PEZI|nr:hypothetical protein LTS18_005575 [Coniosporium uncinatum]
MASNSSFKGDQTPLNDIPSGTATAASPAEQGEALSSSDRLHSQYNDGSNGIAAGEHMQATDMPHPSIFSSHGVHGSTLVDDHNGIAPIESIGAALEKSASEHLADVQLQLEADRIIATEMAAPRMANSANGLKNSGPTTTRKLDDSHRAKELQQAVDALSSAAGRSGFRKKRKFTYRNQDAESGDHPKSHDAGPIRTPKGRWRRSFNVVATRPAKTGNKANARRLNGYNISETEAGHESAQPKVNTCLPKNTTPINEALKLDLEHSECSPNTQAKGASASWIIIGILWCTVTGFGMVFGALWQIGKTKSDRTFSVFVWVLLAAAVAMFMGCTFVTLRLIGRELARIARREIAEERSLSAGDGSVGKSARRPGSVQLVIWQWIARLVSHKDTPATANSKAKTFSLRALPRPARATGAVSGQEASGTLFGAHDWQNKHNIWSEQSPKSKVTDKHRVSDRPAQQQDKQGVIKPTAAGMVVKSGRKPIASADDNDVEASIKGKQQLGWSSQQEETRAETLSEISGTEEF